MQCYRLSILSCFCDVFKSNNAMKCFGLPNFALSAVTGRQRRCNTVAIAVRWCDRQICVNMSGCSCYPELKQLRWCFKAFRFADFSDAYRAREVFSYKPVFRRSLQIQVCLVPSLIRSWIYAGLTETSNHKKVQIFPWKLDVRTKWHIKQINLLLESLSKVYFCRSLPDALWASVRDRIVLRCTCMHWINCSI